MKRIILTVLSTLFLTTSAFAVSIGLSGTALYYDASGTETTKSSNQKNEKSENGVVPMPSLFIENELDTGIVVGIDFVPASAKAADFDNARTDTDTDDASDTAGNNKGDINFSNHVTLYVEKPINDLLFVKAGVAFINHDEQVVGGASTSEKTTNAFFGVGANYELPSGLVLRGLYEQYGKDNGQTDVNGSTSDQIDPSAISLSLIKRF